MKILKGKKVVIGVVILVLILSSIATVIICKSMKTIEESKEVSRLQVDELPNYNDSGITSDLGKIEVGERKNFEQSLNYLLYHHTQGWSVGSENNNVVITPGGFDQEAAIIKFSVLGSNVGNDVIAVWHNGEKVARYSIQVVAKPSISFSKTNMTLAKGSYGTFTVTYTGNIVNSVVNDSTIAHIDYRNYGSPFTVTVTADKVGTTPIVFTTSNGVESVYAILNLTVTDSGGTSGPNGPSVSFDKETLTVAKGNSATFKVTYAGTIVTTPYEDSIASVNFDSSTNPMTVTVTGKAAGTTQIRITAIAVNTSAYDVLTLTVTDSGSGGGGGRNNNSSSTNQLYWK